jgi:hypothetical protein
VFIGLLSFFAVAAVAYWLRSGGWNEAMGLLQPGFTVTEIDQQQKTMTLSRVREGFVVSCGNRCDLFEVGKSYTMQQRAAVLEFTRKAEKIELPILREHVDLETAPGGHG